MSLQSENRLNGLTAQERVRKILGIEPKFRGRRGNEELALSVIALFGIAPNSAAIGEAVCECGCGMPAPIAKKTKAASGHIKGQPVRFVHGHNHRPAPFPVVADGRTGCLNWQWHKTVDGYGRIRLPGDTRVMAHRFVYEQIVGPIPEGLTLDHLCRNTSCVNPEHLEPVSNVENILRSEGPPALNRVKSHCKRGHPLAGANLIRRGDGGRECRACRDARSKAFRAGRNR